jgi:hypothetical protein
VQGLEEQRNGEFYGSVYDAKGSKRLEKLPNVLYVINNSVIDLVFWLTSSPHINHSSSKRDRAPMANAHFVLFPSRIQICSYSMSGCCQPVECDMGVYPSMDFFLGAISCLWLH